MSTDFGEPWAWAVQWHEPDQGRKRVVCELKGGVELYAMGCSTAVIHALYPLEQLGLASVPDPARAIEDARKALEEAERVLSSQHDYYYDATRDERIQMKCGVSECDVCDRVRPMIRAALAGLGGTT